MLPQSARREDGGEERGPLDLAIAPPTPDPFMWMGVENLFYKVGTPVTLFYGGAKLGTATTSSSNIEGRDAGCVDLRVMANFANYPITGSED